MGAAYHGTERKKKAKPSPYHFKKSKKSEFVDRSLDKEFGIGARDEYTPWGLKSRKEK